MTKIFINDFFSVYITCVNIPLPYSFVLGAKVLSLGTLLVRFVDFSPSSLSSLKAVFLADCSVIDLKMVLLEIVVSSAFSAFRLCSNNLCSDH